MDVSGIPNLGFGGGPLFTGGYSPNVNPVDQNRANLAYVGGVDQASLNPNTLYGSGGFGRATDYYSAAGAAYGRATGYYGDTSGLPPGTVTPAQQASSGNYQDTGAYADYNSLNPQQQAYYDAHVQKYGYAPSFNNPSLLAMGGGGGGGGGGAPSVFNTGAPAYNTYGQPGTGSVGNPLYDSLDPGGKAYYDAHVLRYGAPPDASNPNLHRAAPAAPPGPGASVQPGPFAPGGPTASDPYSGGGHPTDPGEGAALDPSTWNAAQKAYANAHILKYNTLPGANNATMRSLADAPPMEEAPPNSPGGLVTAGGFSPTTTIGGGGGGFTQPTDPGEGAALDPSTWNAAQKAYAGAHVLKYNTLPGANNSTMRSLADPGGGPFQSATGDVGQSPGMAPGMGGFSPAGFRTDPGEGAPVVYENLNDPQKAYFRAHYERYGTAPGANNSTLMGMSNNVGDFQQEAINQGQQSMHTLLDQVGAALNPTPPSPTTPSSTAPSDTLTDADRFIGIPTDPGEGAALNPSTWNAAQKAYANAHLLRYGTLPGANNATMSGMADATPMSGPGSGVDAIEKFAGIDPSTGNQYPPGVDRTTGRPYGVPPPTPGEALPFSGTPVNPQQPQQPDFYRSPEQSYKTFQAQNPMVWQKSIANNDPNVMNAIYAAAGNTGVDPAALAAVFKLEGSNYDPRYHTKGQYGVAQMSQDMWADNPFGGTIGGLTWDQYQNQATAAQQIGAYADWLTRSGNLNKSGLSGIGDQTPELQAAILQGIQFAPNSPGWRTALVGGNMSVPTTADPQATDLGTTSIGDMEEYYRNLMAGWK